MRLYLCKMTNQKLGTLTPMSKYKNLEKLFNEGCHFFSVQFLTLGIIYYAYVDHITSNFLKAVFHKFYLIHS